MNMHIVDLIGRVQGSLCRLARVHGSIY